MHISSIGVHWFSRSARPAGALRVPRAEAAYGITFIFATKRSWGDRLAFGLFGLTIGVLFFIAYLRAAGSPVDHP